MIAINKKGDSHISPFQHKLWNFTYTVLQKFGCPIQFNVFGPFANHKINQTITFFVPDGRGDVADYIVKEWLSEVRPESEFEGEWFWGSNVQVMFFSGPDLYTDQEFIEDMAQNMMLYLQAKLQKKPANVVDFTRTTTTKH